MKWWSLFGLSRRLTESLSLGERSVAALPRAFRRSLHLYPVDLGNSNALNMEISAMKTAAYNVHRFGIFFAASPRHADLLLLLGDPLPQLAGELAAVLEQVPRPFGAVWVRESPAAGATGIGEAVTAAGGTMVATIEELTGPEELISVLRLAMRGRA